MYPLGLIKQSTDYEWDFVNTIGLLVLVDILNLPITFSVYLERLFAIPLFCSVSMLVAVILGFTFKQMFGLV